MPPRRPPGNLSRTLAGEDDFEGWVRQRALERGWCGFHIRDSEASTRGIHTTRTSDHMCGFGWPDWVFIRDRQILFRELKTDQGRLSIHQRRWIAQLAAAGQDVDVWRPRDELRILRELAYPDGTPAGLHRP